jgi:hypothetical protein
MVVVDDMFFEPKPLTEPECDGWMDSKRDKQFHAAPR